MYNLKNKMVYAIEESKGFLFFRRAYETGSWKPLTDGLHRKLQPLRESERMKENDWKSQYYWELPYRESYKFREWLQSQFDGSRYSFHLNLNMTDCSPIRITHNCRTIYNEVNEPFLDCDAHLPKEIIAQVCDIIMQLWSEHCDE